MDELVSIIMPSYNTGKYIKESIESVLSQSYQNWELVIVDDCSTDNTDSVVAEYNDKRIRYFKNEKNCGAAESRNYALRVANGKWIAFLDSDDIWKPEKLRNQISFMKRTNCHFSYTNYTEIDMDGYETGVLVTGPKRITKTGFYNYDWIGCLTAMYDRDVVGLVQVENIRKNNDYAMWLKVSLKADCFLLDESLAQYRRGRVGSISTNSIKTMVVWHYRLFRNVENCSIFGSVLLTVRNIFFGFYKKIRYVKKFP